MAISDIIGDSVKSILNREKKSSGTGWKDVLSDSIKRKSLDNPMKSHLWRLMLPPISPAFGVHYNRLVDTKKTELEELVKLHPDLHNIISSRLYSVSSPHINIETGKALHGNSFWYYAKTNDIGTITLDVYEYEDGLTLQYFNMWIKLMKESNEEYEGYYPPVLYKKNIVLHRLSNSMTDIVTHTYKGYFISGITDTTTDYETDSVLKYQITLTGDAIKTTIHDAATLGQNDDDDKLIKQIFDKERRFGNITESIGDIFTDEISNRFDIF